MPGNSTKRTVFPHPDLIAPGYGIDRPRVELCGMRGGIDRPVGVAGGIVRGETDHPLAVEFTEAEPFTRCERCTTEMVCYWLEQCAYAERIATEGLVR